MYLAQIRKCEPLPTNFLQIPVPAELVMGPYGGTALKLFKENNGSSDRANKNVSGPGQGMGLLPDAFHKMYFEENNDSVLDGRTDF